MKKTSSKNAGASEGTIYLREFPKSFKFIKFVKHFSAVRWFVKLAKSKSPLFFLIGTAFWVFCAEVIVMFFFMAIPKLSEIEEALLDGTLLSILVAPALYYFIYSPLRTENIKRELIEKELRQLSEQLKVKTQQLEEYSQILELKVAERTQELNSKNSHLQEILEELRSTQLQMVQSEKMSSLGQLVAGIAHEINNPVSFIHGNLSHVDRYSKDLLKLVQVYQSHYPNPPKKILSILDELELDFLSEDLGKILQSMQSGTNRIRQIVVSLQNFSWLDRSELMAVDLHECIDNTLNILDHKLRGIADSENIEVLKDYGELPLVECYPSKINQVFMNLLSNAIYILEESVQSHKKQSRRIWITTQVVNDDWVQIAIADNGIGIPEDLQARIFDPFFTTKPVGKGTGLGLSISYQIVTERHKGSMRCESSIGEGTIFAIDLPIRQTKSVFTAIADQTNHKGIFKSVALQRS